MDGCMYGMYVWMDGWMDAWMDGCMHACMYVCIYGPVSRVPESVSLGDHTIGGGQGSGVRTLICTCYIIPSSPLKTKNIGLAFSVMFWAQSGDELVPPKRPASSYISGELSEIKPLVTSLAGYFTWKSVGYPHPLDKTIENYIETNRNYST